MSHNTRRLSLDVDRNPLTYWLTFSQGQSRSLDLTLLSLIASTQVGVIELRRNI